MDEYHPTLGNFVFNHARVASKKFKISIIHVYFSKDINDKKDTIMIEKVSDDLNIIRLKIKYKTNYLSKLFTWINSWIKLFKLAEKQFGKLDLVHLNVMYPAGFIAVTFKILFSVEFVITEHSTVYSPARERERNSLIKFVTFISLYYSRSVSAVSNNLLNCIDKIYEHRNKKIINNAVKSQLFIQGNSNTDNSKFTFIHISTLVKEHKNPLGILRAFKKIHQSNSNVFLKIITDGNPSIIAKEINELKLETKIEIFQNLSMAEIASHLQKSDCMVLFSNYENMPVVISEAWMCGIPIIATNVGGISEHIFPFNGKIIEPRDEESLYIAMLNMIANKKSFDSIKIRNYAISQFSEQAVADQLDELYNHASI